MLEKNLTAPTLLEMAMLRQIEDAIQDSTASERFQPCQSFALELVLLFVVEERQHVIPMLQ